jgi:hypothetical protein
MRGAIIRSIKNLRISDLYRQIQGEFDYKPRCFLVIKLTLFAKNEVKIVTLI